MKDIFVTGTFRNEWNKEFNLRLAGILEMKGFQVFLPQRDSEQIGNCKETFSQDIAGIDLCKLIVAIGSKTQTANWGFEIGYAYKKKPIVVITDNEHPIELMPEGASSKVIVVKDIDNIKAYIEELTSIIRENL